MSKQIKMEYTASLLGEVGTGPLQTVVYEGSFGALKFARPGKRGGKKVLIKKIKSKIMSSAIDWTTLSYLDHPNVATYTFLYEHSSLFSSDTYIVQDFCQNTLQQLAMLFSYNWLSAGVVKNAVKEIAAGLNYLHGKSIVHRNLKPSNVLVKPPLSNPSRYILTDFWYTDYRHVPDDLPVISRCLQKKKIPDETEIVKWMSPELQDHKYKVLTPMMDMYSFGKVLEYLFAHGPLPLDKMDNFLFRLLIQESVRLHPASRVTSGTVLGQHPLVILPSLPDIVKSANARLDYVRESYDRIQNLVRGQPDNVDFIELVETRVRFISLQGSLIFPWNDPAGSFADRLYTEMNKHAETPYNPESFVDLIRLVRNFRKHPLEGKEAEALLHEIENDGLCKHFPFLIPFIYICLDCTLDNGLVPTPIFDRSLSAQEVERMSMNLPRSPSTFRSRSDTHSTEYSGRY